MKLQFLNLILLSFTFVFVKCYQMENNSFIPGLETISQKDLQKTVDYLSSPELEGRLSGSPGYFKAADFAKERFISLGLKPAFGDDYFQKFNVEYNNIISASLKLMRMDGSSKEYILGKDFVCRGFTGSSELKAEVVFCGYGISAPELGYDDYKGINVKGKIVIVFKQNPKWNINGN